MVSLLSLVISMAAKGVVIAKKYRLVEFCFDYINLTFTGLHIHIHIEGSLNRAFQDHVLLSKRELGNVRMTVILGHG